MKKQIIETIILGLLILTFIFVRAIFANTIDPYKFIGRPVMIITETSIYTGTLQLVTDTRICREHDNIGNCLREDIYYTLFLETETDIIIIKSNRIREIKLIE
jgi:hypothetical protein